MKILKNLLNTAKEVYKANSEGQLGEYVGNKVNNVIKQYDGTAEEEFIAQRERLRDLIVEELKSDEFDKDYCLALIDRWENECALSEDDFVCVKYYRFRAWENTFYLLSEELKDAPYEESDSLREAVDDANEQCLDAIQEVIDYLKTIDDEDTIGFWFCTVLCAKAERMHWTGENLEAVRLAIQALPYACDEDERKRAKKIISGKAGSNKVINQFGYGIWGFNIEERIQRIEELDNYEIDDESDLNTWPSEMMELCALMLTEDIKDIKCGQSYFSNRPYHDRQFIFTVRDLDHIGGCYDETDNIQYVFPLDELPGEITFPVGHPQPNTLYYAHPLRPLYLPFENAQLLLFYEKVHEMCRLFQCLGATKITARCLKGKEVSQDALVTENLNAEGGYKVLNGSIGYGNKNSMTSSQKNRDEMSLYQIFSPQKAPYCPNDLLWTKEDPELRTLIKQRLEGGLLEFTKKVSSYEISNLSQSRINDVKVAFESLMANVSGNYSSSNDQTFSQTSETEWEISVEFKPLEEFEDFISPAKQKAIADARKGELIVEVSKFFYKKEQGIFILDTLQSDIKVGDPVIVCNEDSEFDSSVKGICMFYKMIDEGEKNDVAALLLSGITATNIQPGTKIYHLKKSSISESETAITNHTEESAPQTEALTQEEEKYKEELLFCLEDGGTITEEDRRYLERKRNKFGISKERAMEIEKQLTPSLSEEEKEYLETFKELTTSGGLTDRTRRLLERERESLNISLERASEIEKIANEKK